MPGLHDLTQHQVTLPPLLLLDTSIAVVRATAFVRPVAVTRLQRVEDLFASMRRQRCTPVVASVSVQELFHVVVRTRYQALLPRHRASLLNAFPHSSGHTWRHLYKLQPELMRGIIPDLLVAQRSLQADGTWVLRPDDLDAIRVPDGHDMAVIRLMERYELDSADAATLLEAQRAGINAVASLDGDWVRASADFDVHTWR